MRSTPCLDNIVATPANSPGACSTPDARSTESRPSARSSSPPCSWKSAFSESDRCRRAAGLAWTAASASSLSRPAMSALIHSIALTRPRQSPTVSSRSSTLNASVATVSSDAVVVSTSCAADRTCELACAVHMTKFSMSPGASKTKSIGEGRLAPSSHSSSSSSSPSVPRLPRELRESPLPALDTDPPLDLLSPETVPSRSSRAATA